MEYALYKYRGWFDSTKMKSSQFLYFATRLQKDINDKALDPYPHKMVQMVQAR